MTHRSNPEIQTSVTLIGDALEESLKASGADLPRKIDSVKKKLPRTVRRSAEAVARIEERVKHQPFVLESQKRELAKAERKITKFAKAEDTRKEDRRSARIQWLSGLVLNYLIFLLLLAGFWYVGTQT